MTTITVNYPEDLQERLIAFFEAGSKNPKFLSDIRFEIENGTLAVFPTIESTAYFEGDHNRSSIGLQELTEQDGSTPLPAEELTARVLKQLEIRDNHNARVQEGGELRIAVGEVWVEQQGFQSTTHLNGYITFEGPKGEDISGSPSSLSTSAAYRVTRNTGDESAPTTGQPALNA